MCYTGAKEQEHFEGNELPDGKQIEEEDEGRYKYLGVLEWAKMKAKEMKEVSSKEYHRRMTAVAWSRLYAGNLWRDVNGWSVSVMRYTLSVW